jgi:hypothetical protein
MLEDGIVDDGIGILGFKAIIPVIQYSIIPRAFQEEFQWQLIKDHRISPERIDTYKDWQAEQKIPVVRGFLSRMSTKSSSNTGT